MPKQTIIKNGDDLYNFLMEMVEPELTTGQIPMLKKKYNNETEGEKKTRMKHYQEAFAEYDELFTEFVSQVKTESKKYRKNAYATAEQKSKEEEAQVMQEMESIFSS